MMLPGCSPGAKSLCGSPLSDKNGSPDSRAGAGGSEQALLVLLLNTSTKDEGEEFLDYCYPVEDRGLQALLNMKGVLLASCGVMRAAAGQSLTLLVFWSADRMRQYKAAMQRVECWILCVVLPAAAPDSAARFFAETAAELVSLRFGSMTSLARNFKQLDPIFRNLSGAWQSLHSCLSSGACSSWASAGLLYTLFGCIPWGSFSKEWYNGFGVGESITAWEAKVKSGAEGRLCAQPEGFALFLDHLVVGTSLDDAVFKVCLQLCLLEGELNTENNSGMQDLRCHSLFLPRPAEGSGEPVGAPLLPTHQYSLVRRGPWLLFVLWRMLPPGAEATPGASPSAALLAGGDDPFATDLCMGLLASLPWPDEYVAKLAAQAARAMEAKKGSGGSSSKSGKGQVDLKRSFSLPCPGVLKPLVSRSNSGSLKKLDAPPIRHSRALHTMELQAPLAASSSDTASPSSLGLGAGVRRPRLAASDRWLPAVLPPRCPEAVARYSQEASVEWMTTHPSAMLVPEWCELDWLILDIARRRASWLAAPPPASTRQAMMTALRGAQSLDKLWNECLSECERAASEGAWVEDVAQTPRGAPRREGPTLLGSGEPWRFQANSPFHLSDLSPLCGAGVLRSSPQGAKFWAAVSLVGKGSRSFPLHRILLFNGLGGDASGTPTRRASTPASTPATSPGRTPLPGGSGRPPPQTSPGGRFQPVASPAAAGAGSRPATFSPMGRPPMPPAPKASSGTLGVTRA